jgi:autophagy-related protein 11
VLEERNIQLIRDASERQTRLESALADATDQARAAESLRAELARVRAEAEDLRSLEARNAVKIGALVREQELALRKLEEARARGENLESQIASAQGEGERVRTALEEAERDKDRLLRVQANEHDRALRDHIAEADGDRAVLEHQHLETRARLEATLTELADARADRDVAYADAAGLREELARVEKELRDARLSERLLRDDLRTARAARVETEEREEKAERRAAQLLDVALQFRTSHERALSTAQAATSAGHHHGALSKTPPTGGSLADSVFSVGLTLSNSGLRRPGLGSSMPQPFTETEPPPIDPSDPDGALEALRVYDHDILHEAVSRTGSTIRKWQRQCKDYRERAKGRIAFRNFAKGDLALFLPTRNSLSKPWAAFNGQQTSCSSLAS